MIEQTLLAIFNKICWAFQQNVQASHWITQACRKNKKISKTSFGSWLMTHMPRFFEDKTLDKFWAMMQHTYPKVSAKPLTLSAAFPSTHLWISFFKACYYNNKKSEQIVGSGVFFAMCNLKNKTWHCIHRYQKASAKLALN